ncbi:LIM domain only protein 3 isoform X2 [Osmia lignaria lignaria]|uniref:LIM domain only protein 3-like n=1 Tax=Osmia bicornis bicornis TaxID=1437191 RepID=UPI0010F68C59|nr:LIM domain only protein 3-like [Osmia bicornis bicornis]XP_029041621.1 LIM domain only protein 3-like [Osmia bicornis bicornis]XP_034170954.1 LIM domain only protein 3-like isoform X2 [Osmia lignaria]
MTMDVSKSEPSKNGTTQQECAGCGKTITERYLLKALDLYWHEDCLKCGCCDCRLGEVGSTLFTKANLILCKRDYLRLFGNTGNCAACNKQIPAFEMVMKARTNVYHLDCFACQQCTHRFCVGDRFYLCENKILCEYDYEERLAFANMSLQTPASLAYIKRQLPPTPTPPGQNMHPGHNPLQPHQGLGQSVGQHNHVSNGQMSGGTPTVNGTTIGVGGPRAPGDMNNNGLSGPALGPVKPPPMSMQAPTS